MTLLSYLEELSAADCGHVTVSELVAGWDVLDEPSRANALAALTELCALRVAEQRVTPVLPPRAELYPRGDGVVELQVLQYCAGVKRLAVGQEPVRRCRICGCTEDDCGGCVARTGHPCSWVAADLCSACTS